MWTITLHFDKGFMKTAKGDNLAAAIHDAIKVAISRLGDSSVKMVIVEGSQEHRI